ncbi:hypothetical protein SDC9_207806 [bioreactor metagenome]|uniref:Uncharacterized protein n=1 Tax=bioreactor metagenome TaxID=1076179 RepID=A0A645JKC2_9ZZZZ
MILIEGDHSNRGVVENRSEYTGVLNQLIHGAVQVRKVNKQVICE